MNKTAIYDNLRNLTPAEIFFMTGGMGAGGFGAMRLVSEALRRSGQQPAPKEKTIPLMFKDPSSLANNNDPQEANPALDSSVPAPISKIGHTPVPELPMTSEPWLPQALAAGVGLPAGFLGAKSLYDMYKKHELDQQTELAKQKYMAQLDTAEQMKGKFASATPLVDEFCEGISKQGEFPLVPEDTMIQNPYMRAMEQHNLTDNGHAAIGHAVNGVTGGGWGDAKQTLGLLAAISGVGTLGYLINNNQAKRQKEQKSQYPIGVSYAQ